MPIRNFTLHAHPAPRAGGHPPLLFVHGAYTHSQCWMPNFVPYFKARGFDCYTLDLSGHGVGADRASLHELGLDDYAEDLAEAVATLPALPILIGHSMGSLVVQRYLTSGRAAGLALLSPVPPIGTGGSAARLALTCPEFFAELPRVTAGQPTARSLEVMAGVYFSPEMSLEGVLECLPMIQEESELAVAQMAALAFQPAGHRPDIPALVMGGREDAVFPPSMLFFTALAWRARQVVVEGAGHMLMLDPQWEEAARALAEWAEGVPPVPRS